MPLDDADKKFIAELLDTKITTSLGEADKRFDAKLKAEREEVKKLLPSPKDEPKPGDADKRTEDGKFKPDPRFAALEKQLADEKAAREKSEADRKTEQLRSAAQNALTAEGISGDQARRALALLDNAEGRLGFTEDGQPALKFKRNGYDEMVPLKAGVAEWAKTDDGKAYLPPSNAQGTGTGAGGRPGPRAPITNPDDLDLSGVDFSNLN